MSVSISLSVCAGLFVSVCLQAYLQKYKPDLHQLSVCVCVTHDSSSILLRRRCETLCIPVL